MLRSSLNAQSRSFDMATASSSTSINKIGYTQLPTTEDLNVNVASGGDGGGEGDDEDNINHCEGRINRITYVQHQQHENPHRNRFRPRKSIRNINRDLHDAALGGGSLDQDAQMLNQGISSSVNSTNNNSINLRPNELNASNNSNSTSCNDPKRAASLLNFTLHCKQSSRDSLKRNTSGATKVILKEISKSTHNIGGKVVQDDGIGKLVRESQEPYYHNLDID